MLDRPGEGLPLKPFLRLWLAALVGGVVSGLGFARLGLRPWEAWPVGIAAGGIAWMLSRRGS